VSTDSDTPPIETIEMVAPFDDQQTPRSARVGKCWRCKMITPVTIVAPPPGSDHEALSLPSCVASRSGVWAWCAVTFFIRLGEFELYLGPEQRAISKLPPLERRAPPAIPPDAKGSRE
jgi:hypothetical protein